MKPFKSNLGVACVPPAIRIGARGQSGVRREPQRVLATRHFRGIDLVVRATSITTWTRDRDHLGHTKAAAGLNFFQVPRAVAAHCAAGGRNAARTGRSACGTTDACIAASSRSHSRRARSAKHCGATRTVGSNGDRATCCVCLTCAATTARGMQYAEHQQGTNSDHTRYRILRGSIGR